MAKPAKETSGSRVQIIQAITAPLGFYVLGLLIVEAFVAVITVASGFQREDSLVVIKLGAGLFAYVVCIVSVLVWCKPANLMFDKDSILIDRGKMPNQEELRPSTVADAAATRETLERFWRPDGKTTHKRNKARLEKWKKANGIARISLTVLTTAESFAEFRRKAIRDLGIDSGERS